MYTGLNYIDAEWDQVVCDGYAAAETALMHLIRLGHRRIGYIGETDENCFASQTDRSGKHRPRLTVIKISGSTNSSLAQVIVRGFIGFIAPSCQIY